MQFSFRNKSSNPTNRTSAPQLTTWIIYNQLFYIIAVNLTSVWIGIGRWCFVAFNCTMQLVVGHDSARICCRCWRTLLWPIWRHPLYNAIPWQHSSWPMVSFVCDTIPDVFSVLQHCRRCDESMAHQWSMETIICYQNGKRIKMIEIA